MKRLLSFLLCIVFLHVQTATMYGHVGGPDFGDSISKNINLVGTYSGVLTPQDASVNPNKALNGDVINALGLFSLGVPDTGPATGTFLLFADGITLSGTITAVGDSGKGTLNGVVDASFSFTSAVFDSLGNAVLDPTTNAPLTQDIQAQVFGTVKASVDAGPDLFSTATTAATFTTFQRITGTAEMGQVVNVPPANLALESVITYDVDGVKQSGTVLATTALAPGGGTGTGAGGGGGGGGGLVLLVP